MKTQLAAVLLGAALLALSACGVNSPRAAGGSASSEEIDAYLSAPEDAEVIEPTNKEPVTDPITKESIVLPWSDAYPVPEGPIGDPNKEYNVCYSQALIRHPWSVGQRSAMMIEAARHPNLTVKYYNTDNDPLQQIQQLETCANQDPDAILVWPHSTAPLTPVVKKLHEDGHIVVGMGARSRRATTPAGSSSTTRRRPTPSRTRSPRTSAARASWRRCPAPSARHPRSCATSTSPSG